MAVGYEQRLNLFFSSQVLNTTLNRQTFTFSIHFFSTRHTLSIRTILLENDNKHIDLNINRPENCIQTKTELASMLATKNKKSRSEAKGIWFANITVFLFCSHHVQIINCDGIFVFTIKITSDWNKTILLFIHMSPDCKQYNQLYIFVYI